MTNILKVKHSLHPLFIVILMLSIFTGYFIEILLLFMFVIAHEYGHFFMAKHFAWKINEIKLLPFGGVLVVDDAQATNAREESLVALAGPLQNLIIIILVWLCGQFHWLSYDWVAYIIKANLWLIAFNLLPISPLDGGKITQALLSLILPYFQVIKVIAWTSLAGAATMITIALTYGLWSSSAGPQLNLLLVGGFLFADNMMKLKHLHFLLYRFVLQRSKMLEKISGTEPKTEAIPILVQEQDTFMTVFKKIKRESHHLFYYRSSKSNVIEMKPEHELLEKIKRSPHLNRALIDYFD